MRPRRQTSHCASFAQALCRVINVPRASLTCDEAAVKPGPLLAGFLSMENKASNRKAREELGWEIKERGILSRIASSMYVEAAKTLEEGRAAQGI